MPPTANAVRSISDRIVFVDSTHAQSDSTYGQDREVESQLSLESLGIAIDRQTYVHLPDTKLVKYLGALALDIANHALRNNLHDYFTLGPEGYDGHSDHIATHRAARLAQIALGSLHPLHIWALSRSGPADARANAAHTPKLRALAFHQTQMPLRRARTTGELQVTDQRHWDTFVSVYGDVLFAEERYKVIHPARHVARAAVHQLIQPA